MTRWHWFARTLALSGIFLLMSWLLSATMAQTPPASPCPCPNPNSRPNACVPNVQHYGHWETRWRHWPGQPPLAQTNPLGPGREVLPTPEGQEIVPLPKATPRQPAPPEAEQQQPAPGGESILPPLEGRILPHEGAILPPESAILPPEGAILPPGGTLPKTPGTETKPANPAEGGLPGLPTEPDKSLLPPPAKATTETLPDVKKPTSPKVEPKPVEPLPPKDAPKANAGASMQPPRAALPQPETWRNDRQPIATLEPPIIRRSEMENNALVSLAGGMEPERNAMLPGAYRADSIAVTPSGSSANQVEPTSYAAMPSVALNGYCPVELSQNGRWASGDLRWTVVHQGHIYRLSGAKQWEQFSANPDSFAPVNSGDDVVLAASENRVAPGQPAYCATYNGRLYMFSSAATQAEFNRNPQRYAVK